VNIHEIDTLWHTCTCATGDPCNSSDEENTIVAKRIIFRMNPRPLNEMQLALMGIPVGGTAVEGSAGGQRRGVRAARARSPADATARPETAKEEAEEEAKEKAEEAMKEEAKEEAEEAMKEEAAAEAAKKRKKEPPFTEEEDYHHCQVVAQSRVPPDAQGAEGLIPFRCVGSAGRRSLFSCWRGEPAARGSTH
jgi:hypothetical protein